MDIRKVKKLIELLEESNINELEITEGEDSVRISRGVPAAAYAAQPMMAAPMVAAPLAAPAAVAKPAAAAAKPAGSAAAAAVARGASFCLFSQYILFSSSICESTMSIWIYF